MKAHFCFPVDKLRAALICAAKNDVRYYLNGILFARHGAGMVAVSTDGHRLSAIYSDERECEPDATELPESFAIIVPADVIANACKAHKSRTVSVLLFEIQPADGTADAARLVTIGANAGESQFSAREVEGRFPDWQKVIPPKDRRVIPLCASVYRDKRRRHNPAEPYGINATYLADFGKLAGILRGPRATPGLILRTHADDSIIVDVGTPDALCVVMPLRAEATFPTWFYGERAAA
jgi:hypothetical protein